MSQLDVGGEGELDSRRSFRAARVVAPQGQMAGWVLDIYLLSCQALVGRE